MTVSSGMGGESAALTSTTFLNNLRARRPDAWRRLVKLYGPLVYRWCRQAGVAAEDANDLVQEVFQSVAVHLPNYRHDRPGDSFRGWLRTIAHNKVCNFFRGRAAEVRAVGGTDAQRRLEQVADPPLDDSDVGQQMEEETGLAHRALEMIRAEFEDRTWWAFYATTVEGRSGRDVAAELGMSVQAVYKAKSRVLQRIREEMSE
jgi:RNA polymerase sigma-70 factor (ECF subfamily)